MKKNAGRLLADRGYMSIAGAKAFADSTHAQCLSTERAARTRAIGELTSTTPAIREAALVRLNAALK